MCGRCARQRRCYIPTAPSKPFGQELKAAEIALGMNERAATRAEDNRGFSDSLQARLIASHVIVLLLALGLVLLISAAFLRRYERDAAEDRLADLAVPLVAEVNVARLGERVDESRAIRLEAFDTQAEAMELRLLIVDADGRVRYDTSDTDDLRRQDLPAYADTAATVIREAQDDRELHYRFVEPSGDDPFAGEQVLIAAGQTGLLPARQALLIVTGEQRIPLVRLFLPRLLFVSGISLLIASLAGYLLSRYVARPVERLTLAADAMARGNLEQRVDGGGDDEIGRLIDSFNTMSARVAATYRSQRDLLANVAHELRTPLTSVQGYAQALRERVAETDAERDAALAAIGRESERMSALIGQLLDLARLESGQTALAMRPVSVAAMFERVEERFRPLVTERGIALNAVAPPGLAVRGDGARLEQIVGNLVANAIRHTPPSGRIALDARPLEGTPLARLTVRDTGEGIDPERLGRIFDRFERDDRDDSPANAGGRFGLGLAIVKELAELHGGGVSVESERGRGSMFAVDLPAAPSG